MYTLMFRNYGTGCAPRLVILDVIPLLLLAHLPYHVSHSTRPHSIASYSEFLLIYSLFLTCFGLEILCCFECNSFVYLISLKVHICKVKPRFCFMARSCATCEVAWLIRIASRRHSVSVAHLTSVYQIKMVAVMLLW